jgi:hypothetical protein
MIEVTCLRRGFGRQAEQGKVIYKMGNNRLIDRDLVRGGSPAPRFIPSVPFGCWIQHLGD